MQENKISIEICYISKIKTHLIQLEINENTSIMDAIKLSNLINNLKTEELFDLNTPIIGIYGKKIDYNNYKLKNFDRIEIYRKLNKSPNEKRLERLKNAK